MRRETMVPKKVWIDCESCQYAIGLTQRERDEAQTAEGVTTTLRIPWPTDGDGLRENAGFLVFHFHGPDGRERDCFRMWAHDQRLMKRSLTDRGLPESEIEEFLATHLFREEKVQLA